MGKRGRMPLLLALSLIFIISGTITPVFAAKDLNWIEKQSGTKLYWGDSAVIEGYEIKAEDFSEDMVFISVSKNGKVLKTSPLSSGMELVCDDIIKIYAQEVNPNYETIEKDGKIFRTQNKDPYVELKLFVSGEPQLEVKVETEKDIYNPKNSGDNRIEVLVNIKNTGDADAKDLILTVSSSGMEFFDGKPEYKFGNLRKEETLEPIKLILKAPAPWEARDYNINAKVICSDVKGKKYESSSFKSIKIEEKWGLVISKNYKKESHMGKTIGVSLNVRNKGLCNIDNIQLKDSLLSEMQLKEKTPLEKTLSLKAGETAEKVFEYTLIPQTPGEFTFPKAIATFTLPDGQAKQIESNGSEPIKIYGPKITVTKTIDKEELNSGEELNVELNAQNSGNVDANVTLSDFIPPEAELISGNTGFSQVLGKNGESRKISYTLRMNREGKIRLPACKARFIDLDKYSGEVYSERPVVYVGSPVSKKENAETAEKYTESEEENYTQSEENNSDNEGNESSGTEDVNKEDNSEKTPAFDLFSGLIGILGIKLILKKNLG